MQRHDESDIYDVNDIEPIHEEPLEMKLLNSVRTEPSRQEKKQRTAEDIDHYIALAKQNKLKEDTIRSKLMEK